MDLCNRAALQDLLSRHGIALAKTYGQHFLVDRAVLDVILEAAFPNLRSPISDLQIIEIGPGVGTLTVELARRAQKVVAIERDPRFPPVLAETLAAFPNVEVIRADALAVSFSSVIARSVGRRSNLDDSRDEIAAPRTARLAMTGGDRSAAASSGDGVPNSNLQSPISKLETPNSNLQSPISYDIVSNLPYEITTPFLWKVLAEEPVPPCRVTLLLQADVVARILARPPRMNLLALLVALSGVPRLVRKVSASCFFPPPKVESAVITIEVHRLPTTDYRRRARALSLARIAFASPRRKLSSTLGKRAGAHADRRPSELSPENWLELAA